MARVDNRASRVVLHVGEEPQDLALLRRALASRPEQGLVVARDAWSAIPMAHVLPLALVVLGCRRPDFCDHEVLNMLHSLPGCARLPVIAMAPCPIWYGDGRTFAALWKRPLHLEQVRDDLERLLPAPRWDHATASPPPPPDSELGPLSLYPEPVAWHGHRFAATAWPPPPQFHR